MSYKLVLVDDEVNLLMGFSMTLQEAFEELQIITFSDSVVALEYLKNNTVDILISDICMPQIDGLTLAKEMIKFHEDVMIIFLTGYNKFEYAYDALKIKNVSYLMKLEPEEVLIELVQKKIDILEKEKEEKKVRYQNEAKAAKYDQYMKDIVLKMFFQGGLAVSQLREVMIEVEEQYEYIYVNISKYCSSKFDRIKEFEKLQYLAKDFFRNQLYKMVIMDDYNIILLTRELSQNELQIMEFQNQLYSIMDIASIVCFFNQKVKVEELPLLYEMSLRKTAIYRYSDKMLCFNLSEELVDENMVLEVQSSQEFINDLESENYDRLLKNINRTYDLIIREKMDYSQGIFSFIAVYNMLLKKYELLKSFHEDIRKNVDLASAFLVFPLEKLKSGIESIIMLMKVTDDNSDMIEGMNLIHNLEQYVLQHIDEDISLLKLASVVNYNPSYLSRYYKQITKKNISSFVRDIKVSKAKELLQNNDYLVKDVAMAIGFYSVSYFSAFFVKNVGLTPQAYRIKYTGKK